MNLGLKNYLDAVSWHNYPSYTSDVFYNPSRTYMYYKPELSSFESDLISGRNVVKNSIGRDIPYLGTEAGLANSFFDGSKDVVYVQDRITQNSERAAANVAMAVITKAAGATMHTYFFFHDYNYEKGFGLMYNTDDEHFDTASTHYDHKASPKPDIPMIRQANDVIAHSDAVGSVSNPVGLTDVRLYVFKNKDSGVYTIIAWDPTGQSRSISIPVGSKSVTIQDEFGNSSTQTTSGGNITLKLKRAPTYIQGVSISNIYFLGLHERGSQFL
jgi:hypothetical protein